MKKIIRIILIYILIFSIAILSARLYSIKNREILDTAVFTDYFQEGEAENGGLEIVTENFTNFKKEYDFTEEIVEKIVEKKVENIKYTVASGDTLQKIAEKYNISVDTIKINNKNSRTGKLKVGEELNFPSFDGFFYKIRKNDTVGKIAKAYGIKTTDITNYNEVNPKRIKVGQNIFLHGVSLQKILQMEEAERKIKEKPKVSPQKPKENNKVIQKESSISGKGGFAFPVKYTGVASPFGNRFHPVLKRYILHTGVDLKAKYIPLRAAQDGVVSFVGYMNGYGKIIIIKHNSGYETRYAHLSVMSTKVGERVKKGELIGKTGASGRVTGPHLHFEIRRNGTPLNPMKYLS